MNGMTPDDVRALREMHQWYRSHKSSAMTVPQPIRRSASTIGQDWVVVNVKNNCGYNRPKWSGGILTGLIEPDVYSSTNLKPPDGLVDRKFNWEPPDNTSTGGLHAVLIQDLAAGQSGKAVIRGVVPGKAPRNISSTSEYVEEYVHPAIFAAGHLTAPGAWVGTTYGQDLHGSPNFSRVVYAWGATGETSWALIDLNCGASHHVFWTMLGVESADLGVVYGSTALPNGVKTSVYAYDGLLEGETPFAFVTNAHGGAPTVGFSRHCSGICRWTATCEPGGCAGTASGSLYNIPPQLFRFYVRRWTDILGTPTAQPETHIASHGLSRHLAPTNASLHDQPFLISGMFGFSTGGVSSSYPDAELPVLIEIRCQWSTTGTSPTDASIIDFTTEWEISQAGARAGDDGIDFDGEPLIPTRPIVVP